MPLNKDVLLAEYQAAHDSFHHFDSFRWQSGSLLIAGSLVIWGFLFSNASVKPGAISITSIFISLIISAWLFYANHYRQLYMAKQFRIHQIEKELGMDLNVGHGLLGITTGKIKIHGSKGHNIDAFVFVIISLFGPVVAVFIHGFYLKLCAPIIVIIPVLKRIYDLEEMMLKSIKERVEKEM